MEAATGLRRKFLSGSPPALVQITPKKAKITGYLISDLSKGFFS